MFAIEFNGISQQTLKGKEKGKTLTISCQNEYHITKAIFGRKVCGIYAKMSRYLQGGQGV